MPEQGTSLFVDDRDRDDQADDQDASDDEIPESVQPTLTSSTARLDDLAEQEPTDDRGTRQVLVSSGTASTYHRQDIHNESEPACGQTLSATHTEWTQKPKGAMERAKVDPCPDPACYGGSD